MFFKALTMSYIYWIGSLQSYTLATMCPITPGPTLTFVVLQIKIPSENMYMTKVVIVSEYFNLAHKWGLLG